MRQRLMILILLLALLPLLVAQPPPPSSGSSQPPPGASPTAEPKDVAAEVNDFYREYWKAWDDRDTLAIANDLSKDFVSLSYSPQGVVQADKPTSVAGIRRFFETVHDRETIWGRSLLSVVSRGADEAKAATRSEFSLRDAGSEIELSLEVLRKGPDGRWRLVRKWTERGSF